MCTLVALANVCRDPQIHHEHLYTTSIQRQYHIYACIRTKYYSIQF